LDLIFWTKLVNCCIWSKWYL